MKNIDEILKGLSKEELETHKDLIEECLQREKDITSAGEIISNNITQMISIYETIVTSVEDISRSLKVINNNISSNIINQSELVETIIH